MVKPVYCRDEQDELFGEQVVKLTCQGSELSVCGGGCFNPWACLLNAPQVCSPTQQSDSGQVSLLTPATNHTHSLHRPMLKGTDNYTAKPRSDQ